MKSTPLYLVLAAVGVGATTAPPTGTTPLREVAAKKDILIGSGAINPTYLNDSQFATVLSREFKSLSPENEMKWSFINPTKDFYDWALLDRLVDFARVNDMVVKGHGLISSCCNPDHITNITDPKVLHAAMTTHFNTIMRRYAGKMDRWDVVTEALKSLGGGLQENFFYNVTGPSYIEEAFRIAHAADEDAKLFINENLVEIYPGKRQKLYDLVSQLVAKDVPIDGVALQMHEVIFGPKPGVITELVDSYKALGLEVTIAEMDVSTLNNTLQTQIYGDVLAEALEAGVTDISFWGFTDKHAYAYVDGAKPLLFDSNYTAKSEYYAVHTALENFACEG